MPQGVGLSRWVSKRKTAKQKHSSAKRSIANADQYLKSGWVWPHYISHRAKTVYQRFNEHVESFKLKCQAADFLALLPVLAHFAEQQLEGVEEIAAERLSFLAGCAKVRAITTCKYARSAIQRQQLAQEAHTACEEHLRVHVNAYGGGSIKPKHHYNMHTAQQIISDGLVYDMFLIERQHLMVKDLAENIKDLRIYARSLLGSVVSRQLVKAEGPEDDRLGGLQGGCATLQGNLRVGKRAKAEGITVSEGDFVLIGGEVGLMRCATKEGDRAVQLLVVEYRCLAQGHFSGHYEPTGDARAVGLLDVALASAWLFQEDGTVHVCY